MKSGLNATRGEELDIDAARLAWADAEHRSRSDVLEDLRLESARALSSASGVEPLTLPDAWERSVTLRTFQGERNVTMTGEYAGILELLNDLTFAA